MASFLLTFLSGAALGLIFLKIKVPGGMMVGALVGAALLNILFSGAFMPSYARLIAQTTAGAFIGSSINRSDIQLLKSMPGPVLATLSGFLFINISVGFIIWTISPLDLITSLMCAVPGGMTDVPIIAADMGADTSKVAAMQFARMVTGVGLFPSFIGWVFSLTAKNSPAQEAQTEFTEENKETSKKFDPYKSFFVTLAVAFAGGFFGKFIGMSGGILLFSMLFVMTFKLWRGNAYLPMWAKRVAQVLAGTYIGSSIGLSSIMELNQVILPVVILLSAYLIHCCVMGLILHKKFKFSLKEGMLAATPAGASDMALIAGDLGVTSPRLVFMQVIRLLAVIAIFPQIIHLIVLLVGS